MDVAYAAKLSGGLFAVLAAILALRLLVLFFAPAIGRLLSDRLRVITTRLTGMIGLAIAVEVVADGAKALLPGIAGG